MNWTTDENTILIEYCNKKIKIEEISIALNKRISDIKYHIGDLAYSDFKNGLTEDDICKKYNLEKKHLIGAISRNKRKEDKKENTKDDKKENTKEDKKDKKDKKENTKEGKKESKKESKNEVIKMLIEIKTLLKDLLNSTKLN
jgi:hypothetical protein